MPFSRESSGAPSKRALWGYIESRLDSSPLKWRERMEDSAGWGLGLMAAIEKRTVGDPWNDDEVFEELFKSVLSGNTDFAKVEKILPELREFLEQDCGIEPRSYLESYAKLPESRIAGDLVSFFKRKKAGAMTLKSALINLRGAAEVLAEYSRTHGAADHYFTSLMHRFGDDTKQVVFCLGLPGSHKLPSLGVSLAAETLKNLGFSVAKPDRHVQRAMGAFGLVHFANWPDRCNRKPPENPTRSELLRTMAGVEQIAKAAAEPVGVVDYAIWSLGARSGLHLPNCKLAEIARDAGASDDRAGGLAQLIQSWMEEDDAGEQRETVEYLIHALDEDRLSDRKLFPKELKGKSW